MADGSYVSYYCFRASRQGQITAGHLHTTVTPALGVTNRWETKRFLNFSWVEWVLKNWVLWQFLLASLPAVLAEWKGQTFRMIMRCALQFALSKGMHSWYWGCDLESCSGSKYWSLWGGLTDHNLFVCYFLQLKLMQSELNVEEVVNDRSWKVLSHSK